MPLERAGDSRQIGHSTRQNCETLMTANAALPSFWKSFYKLHKLTSSTGNPQCISTSYPQEIWGTMTNFLGNSAGKCDGLITAAVHRGAAGAETPRVRSKGKGASLTRCEGLWAAAVKPSGGTGAERGSEAGRSGWLQTGGPLIEDARNRSAAGGSQGHPYLGPEPFGGMDQEGGRGVP